MIRLLRLVLAALAFWLLPATSAAAEPSGSGRVIPIHTYDHHDAVASKVPEAHIPLGDFRFLPGVFGP